MRRRKLITKNKVRSSQGELGEWGLFSMNEIPIIPNSKLKENQLR